MTPPNGYDIVALGDVNMDHVVPHNLAFPLSSLTENGVICWADIDELPGGSGLNFCAFAAEAGHRCLLLGKAGNDSTAAAITQWLTAHGIAVPPHWTAEAPTGKAFILRDSAGIRLVVNNRDNANHLLTAADVDECRSALSTCRVVYVSGYCVNDPRAARFPAALRAMAHARSGPRRPTVVFDVVPHRIHERFDFVRLRELTRHVDILISEVATARRFLRLGSKAETIDETMARETAERLSAYYPRTILRYGPSGCDEEILTDAESGRSVCKATAHDQATDKRGYGDRLALRALTDFFHVLSSSGG